DPSSQLTHPKGYSKILAESIGRYHTLGMPEDTQALNDEAISDEVFLEQCNQVSEEREKMFWYEFNRNQSGLLAFVFDTTDRVQHMFWRKNEVDSEGNVTALGPEILQYYQRMDKIVGDVLNKIDSETAVIAISDHGFTGFH